MSSNYAIEVEAISKIFPIYNKPVDRLKEAVFFGKRDFHRKFRALNNVSFQVEQGTTMGIIGKNGSGKSTLLQIIAGTLNPSQGSVIKNGKVAAILELGAGFNPEFTGKENVFLNGAILGLSQEEIEDRYDEIVAFADIGDFIDQPVKTYSSGMFVRLAFAVAINVDPDILIVDEALAVGDIFFTHKCKNKMREIVDSGKTVLIVSHDILTIKSFCEKAILLEKGDVILQGTGEEVADYYQKSMHEENYQNRSSKPKPQIDSTIIINEGSNAWFYDESLINDSSLRFGEGEARYVGIRLLKQDGEVASLFEHGEEVTIQASIEYSQDCGKELEYGLIVRDINGIDIMGFNSHVMDIVLPPAKKETRLLVSFSFPLVLAPGSYSLALGLKERFPNTHYLDKVYNAAVFEITPLPIGKWVPGLIKVPGLSKVEAVK